MPMVDVTLPDGALPDGAREVLAERLTAALIEGEGAPDNTYVRAIAWCFFDERPPAQIFVGGRPMRQPVYRVVLTVPEGAPGVHGPFALPARAALVRTVTEFVLEAEGTAYSDQDALRVWVQFREIPDGHWGGMGAIARLEDIASLAGVLPPDAATAAGLQARAAVDAAQASASV